MGPFREKGVPAVQQIEDKTGDFNRYYHGAGDTVAHMDETYWLGMMRGLVATAAGWLGAPPSPPPTPASPTPASPSPGTPPPTPAATSLPAPTATAMPVRRAYLPALQRGGTLPAAGWAVEPLIGRR